MICGHLEKVLKSCLFLFLDHNSKLKKKIFLLRCHLEQTTLRYLYYVKIGIFLVPYQVFLKRQE